VSILIIGSVLLGAILERFFTVLVLIPACALTLAMVVASSAYFGHSWPGAVLEFTVLITSLQIGYALGLCSSFIPSVWQRRGKRSSLPSNDNRADTAPVMARERRRGMG
jgi:hypothetical protein